MRQVIALLGAFAFSASVMAAAPSFDQKLLKEVDAFLDAGPAVLSGNRDSGRIGDHTRWAQDLKQRAVVFLGSGSDIERMNSPYRACYQAVSWAREVWGAQLDYAHQPSQKNYQAIERWLGEYQKGRKDCNAAGGR